MANLTSVFILACLSFGSIIGLSMQVFLHLFNIGRINWNWTLDQSRESRSFLGLNEYTFSVLSKSLLDIQALFLGVLEHETHSWQGWAFVPIFLASNKRELDVEWNKKQIEKFKEDADTKQEVALMQERKRLSLRVKWVKPNSKVTHL